MFARMLYFVSVVIAFALIVGTTVLCLAADKTTADPSNLPRLETTR